MRPTLYALARVATVTFGVAILVLSLIPDPEGLNKAMNIFERVADLLFGDKNHGDKVSHFIAYGALSAAAVMGFARRLRPAILVFLGVSLFGAGMELLQGIVGQRVPDIFDFVANIIGTIMGMILGALGILVYRYIKPLPKSVTT